MSKKEQAFELFNQGKRPGDAEVKALGITSKTRFNYFAEWKKSNGVAKDTPDIDEIAELKQEKTKLTLSNQIAELEAKRVNLPERVAKLERQVAALAESIDQDNFLSSKYFFLMMDLVVAIAPDDTITSTMYDELSNQAEKDALSLQQGQESCNQKIQKV